MLGGPLAFNCWYVATALCGAMLGARLGCDAIPARLRKNVAYSDALLQTADRLFEARTRQVVPFQPERIQQTSKVRR